MSHNVHTEVQKNVAYLNRNAELESAIKLSDTQIDTDPHSHEAPPLVAAGWKGEEEKDGGLIVFKMRRKSFVVRLVNSSQHSNVGDCEWTVYGSAPAVNAFLADLGLSAPIKKQGVVESWW